MQTQLTLIPICGLPLINEGDDLAALIIESLSAQGGCFMQGDVLVIAQKIVSKAEGRMIQLVEVKPSKAALELAVDVDKDPRLVELILQESTAVIRKARGVIIVRHRLGIISANAGIDQSNIDHSSGEGALLLPEDPDLSALELRKSLAIISEAEVGVIVSDSMNRPWRLGSLGYAIGSAGVVVIDDRCGDVDIFGRELKVTMSNRADSIAAAATLLMGETTERVPAVLVRGLPVENSTQTARDAIRPPEADLFL